MHVVPVILQDTVNAGAEILPSGNECRPRRRTNRRARVKVRKLNATRRQGIEDGRLDWPAITAEIL